MAQKSGAFSKWVQKNVPSIGQAQQFGKWVAANAHPVEQVEEVFRTHRPPAERTAGAGGDYLAPGQGEAPPPRPKGPVKVPSMLQSKYWRPGAGGKR